MSETYAPPFMEIVLQTTSAMSPFSKKETGHERLARHPDKQDLAVTLVQDSYLQVRGPGWRCPERVCQGAGMTGDVDDERTR